MKANFLWASLLLFAGLTACTDDTIESPAGNGPAGEGTPGYLTISFTANGGASTRANGDGHNSAEDSGHESAGIDGEATVKNALVVIAPVSEAADAFGYAKLYTMKESTPTPPAGDEGDFELIDEDTKTYGNSEPIEVRTGEYNILVVINPATELTSTTYLDATTMEQKTTATVKELYNKILTGAYSYTTTDNYTDAANSIGMGVGYTTKDTPGTNGPCFMMANKEASHITVNASHTPDNPAEATVTVERVLSKITFREKTASGGTAANAYPVTVNLGTAPAITKYAVVQGTEPNPSYSEDDVFIVNQATDLAGETVYASYKAADGSLDKVYKTVKDGDQDKTESIEIDGESTDCLVVVECTANTLDDYNEAVDKSNIYATADTSAPSVDLVFDPDAEVEKETWYVQLEGYALVNLGKTVNYVRHTIGVNGGVSGPFGTLSNNNYLWTPNWEAKNRTDIGSSNITVDNDWFYNKLSDVSVESKTLAVSSGDINWQSAKFFKSFTSLIDDGSTVKGDDHYQDDPKLPAVGKLMTYCFENSTDQLHQVHGLSTGISFVGRIYKNAACTEPIDKLYLYAGHNYTSLQQIAEAYGQNTPQAIKNLIAGTTPETKENLEAAGITLYNGNTCYYYTTEIKHFDNGNDNELGVNEFIIMRNNIYSLSVTTIKEIGAPFVDPTPNTPNETVEAALDIRVTLVPWIVRYNDIEF